MTKIQFNVYYLIYNHKNIDFDVLSLSKDAVSVPSYSADCTNSIDYYLNLISEKTLIDYVPKYRLLNNIIIKNVFNAVYFSLIPPETKIYHNVYKIPVKDHAIYSTNIQKIMQFIQ